MKNIEIWKPSKFIFKNGKLIGNRDQREVNIGSRLLADIIAEFYQTNIQYNCKGKLLDLGCGKVPLYDAYKKYVTENICVDWEESLHKNPHLDYICDLNKKLFFSDNEFDTIILSDVLEHIRKPDLLWAELHRILNNKGKVILNVPFYYWIHEEPYDFHRYTHYALKSIAEEVGFKVLLLEAYGGLPEILTDIIGKSFCKIPFLGKLVSIIIQKFTYIFLKTDFGTKISKKTSKHFPFGYFMIVEKNYE